MELDYEGFLKGVASAQNVAITAPAGADGDSVGTQCSLREILMQKFPGKKVRVINEEPCPQRYLFLKGSEIFEVSKNVLAQDQKTWPDLMICVDGGAPRIGKETTKLWENAKSKAQVDHHMITGPNCYNFRLYDPKAAATTEIIFNLIKNTGIKINQSIAQAIYVGLIFDTGMFKHSNTKPHIMRMAADLMETGFDHTDTAEKAMMVRSQGSFEMLRSTLEKARFEEGGLYVWTVLDYADFQKAGGDADDREGLIDQIFLTQKCQIAALYFERHPKEWKISFRSRQYDVAKLAQSLNASGGGHRQAAGCSLEGAQDSVLEKCHASVKKLLNA